MSRFATGSCIQIADRAKGLKTAADERAESPMSILDPTQITLMRAISGASLRNTVLSNNIANADTPGFQPSDVDFHAALAGALGEGPEAVEDISFAPEQLNPGAVRAGGKRVDSEAGAGQLAR